MAPTTLCSRKSPQGCRRKILDTRSVPATSLKSATIGLAAFGGRPRKVSIKLFTTDNDLISGTPTIFATLLSGPSTAAGAYEAASGRAASTATDAKKRLFVAIDTQDGAGERHGVAHLDDFQLQVTHFPELGAPRLDDFLLQEADFPDPPPAPTAETIIGGNVRNGDFNRK